MKLYKLTDSSYRTRRGMRWGDGVTNHAEPGEPALCSPTVLHAYASPLLAVLLAPIHVSFDDMRLWEAEGEIAVSDGTKVGCKTLTTVREIPLPTVTTEQRVKFAILCALEVYDDPAFAAWASARSAVDLVAIAEKAMAQ